MEVQQACLDAVGVFILMCKDLEYLYKDMKPAPHWPNAILMDSHFSRKGWISTGFFFGLVSSEMGN